MGIEYTANYGIGFEVMPSKELTDSGEDLSDGLSEYLYGRVGDGFEQFENGSYMTGEMEGVFLVMKNPFAFGLNMGFTKHAIEVEMKSLRIEPVGDFGLVGGILIS